MINKKVYSITLLSLILLSSCAKFSFDDVNEAKLKKTDIMCPVKREKILVHSENSKLNKRYAKFMQDHKGSLLDNFFKWSLIQLASRPDATTLNSRTLNFVKYKGKEFFLVTAPKSSESVSFIVGLEEVRKYYKVRRSLNFYAREIDSKFPSLIPVSAPIQNFIERNKVAFYKDKQIRRYVFKGNQIVRQGESIQSPSFQKVIRSLRTMNKDVFKVTQLFNATDKYTCNFDNRLFSSNPIFQRKTNQIKSNFFGVFVNEDNFFISLTSSMPSSQKYISGEFILKSHPISSFNAAICSANKGTKFILAKNLIHSEQLINNVLKSSSSSDGPKEIINLKRHVNLLYPERTIQEIYGRKKIIDKDRSVYNVPTLGKVDIISYNKGFEIFKEPRTGILKCH